jgi:hypothetical protein
VSHEYNFGNLQCVPCVFRSNVANAVALGVDLISSIALDAIFNPVSEFNLRIYYFFGMDLLYLVSLLLLCCHKPCKFQIIREFFKLERERGDHW